MEDQIRNRIKELVAQRDQLLAQVQQNATSVDSATASYFPDQTAGEILTREEVSLTAEVNG